MSRPRLTYFDAPVSRGEECRLALWLGGIEFDDNRIKLADWPALKPKTPYGGMPTLDVPDRGVLAQSNAILVYVGRRAGLHPTDLFEAARHEAMLCHCEDLRSVLGTTLHMADAEKKAAREKMAATTLPAWAAATEAQIGDGPFFGGTTLNIVDLKLHMMVRWLASGRLDHIPATILAAYPKLIRLSDAVRDDARVKAWYARS